MAYKRKDYNMSDASAEKQAIAQKIWHKENYERINLAVRKGEKEKIKAQASKRGESLNAYIIRLIEEDSTIIK